MEMENLITLQTQNTTYQMGVTETGHLLHLYYGAQSTGDLSTILTFEDRGFSASPYEKRDDRRFSLNDLPQEYPVYGNGDLRSPAFNVKDFRGIYGVDLRYKKHSFHQEKYKIPGLPSVYAENAYTVEIVLADADRKLEVILKYGVLPEEDIITRSTVVCNRGGETVSICKAYSATLDFLTGDFELLHFHGRHNMERMMERIPIIHGKQSFESRCGISSHQQNPFFILAEKEANERFGNCYGMMFLYSGNFHFEVECDQFNQVRMQMGLLEEMLEYSLEPGAYFYTPEIALAYSGEGLNNLSHIYHRMIREHVCRKLGKDKKPPVLINSWEASYFNFDGLKLVQLAVEASKLGIELFVLDDGWFGNRNSDKSGLGDWVVNEKKLGGTLKELSKKIHGLGMKFGIWIEPEMVNEDSNLYRIHPDWAFIIPGKKPVMGRNQLVLDFSRKEVVDYIYEQIKKVLDSAEIEYIKMDMNRCICDVYTAVKEIQNYGSIMYGYMLGVYDFMERLNRDYPDMLIESCCGGGGRFDAGMLYYSSQIWGSDDTDAIERLQIQNGTSYGYPAAVVGAHVSAVPNHQTGRSIPIDTRAVVAMSGSFGYELDLNKITDDEKVEIQSQIRAYNKYWPLIRNGLYYRLNENDNYAAWAFSSEDKKEILLNIVLLKAKANAPVQYVKIYGALSEESYRLENDGRIFHGNILKNIGFPVPNVKGEYKAWQYHFVAMQ